MIIRFRTFILSNVRKNYFYTLIKRIKWIHELITMFAQLQTLNYVFSSFHFSFDIDSIGRSCSRYLYKYVRLIAMRG